MKSWHQFLETDDGDPECTGCGVIVSDEALNTFTLPCPAGECQAASNPDGACVFYPRRSEASCCIYCGRPGVKVRPVDLGDSPAVAAAAS